ncbi:hypothetical protein NW801_22160 [Brevibacillus laterosporus]|uniref:Transposase n=1 Tax=Brevibacillus halotolerans TaxID=1507437 RepID=A0ABT4I348_9BACL|nr:MULTISPECIES: hypothetical protein [Brevibacillus]MCR8987698.1 hypothetical protein [Brevibacillus laterosporus]MCZ0833437.1 hypothetical protein [Brevibacillus halotolerans]
MEELLRLQKLEKELNRLKRDLFETKNAQNTGRNRYGFKVSPTVARKTIQRITQLIRDKQSEITFFKKELEEKNIKIWGKEHLKKGDQILTRSGNALIIRVNEKTVLVQINQQKKYVPYYEILDII